jgi:hypothetical protein
MKVVYSKNSKRLDSRLTAQDILKHVSAERLRQTVESLAYPRHYEFDRAANKRAKKWITKQLESYGFQPKTVGQYDNIVVSSNDCFDVEFILLGAHYDSVPGTPGADDNGSAVAVCLESAKLIREHGIENAMVVFFNREEDGLLGSSEFVRDLPKEFPSANIKEAHIFEMVGYFDSSPNSQKLPPGLPAFFAPKTGDFLALLSNNQSNDIAQKLLSLAATYLTEPEVVALKIYFGIENYFGHLHRSDHAPFWKANIPAVMWTDTSEFRNPHYHQETDTPDRLNYEYMAEITKLALARLLVP